MHKVNFEPALRVVTFLRPCLLHSSYIFSYVLLAQVSTLHINMSGKKLTVKTDLLLCPLPTYVKKWRHWSISQYLKKYNLAFEGIFLRELWVCERTCGIQLWMKKKGAKVKLMFEKIKINNIIYIWDGKNQKWYVCLGPSIKEYAQYFLKCHKF